MNYGHSKMLMVMVSILFDLVFVVVVLIPFYDYYDDDYYYHHYAVMQKSRWL